MRYLEVRIQAEREAAEAVEAVLAELTPGGVVVEDPGAVAAAIAEGRWDATDLVPGDTRWMTLKVYLAETPGLAQARQRLAAGLERVRSLGLGAVAEPTLSWVQEEDWAHNWKQYFKPLRVGRRLVVVPSWETFAPGPEELPLYLDPGMAFGTGQHATSALCLGWLEEELQPGEAVLDVGTGSGILAIAAARLGAATVLGLEVDPVAVQVARENVERNGVTERVQVAEATLADPAATTPAAAPDSTAPAATTGPEATTTGPEAAAAARWLAAHRPTLAVANLTADILIALRRGLAAALPAGGRLLASGVVTQRRDEVLPALAAVGLKLEEVREREAWLALRFRRT